MVNFGYSAMVAKVHDLDRIDQNLFQKIAEIDPSINLCISCGSCTATCTAGNFTKFSFREMCHSIRRGEVKEAFKESEKCMMCGKCMLVCPRNVNTRNIIRLVRMTA